MGKSRDAMWIRMRLDIGWCDLMAAFAFCMLPGKRSKAMRGARDSWRSSDPFLVTRSVRSGFDLLLRALQLPAGSEVLLSALTVPDMVRIVKLHGLIPVPVDVDEQGELIAESFHQAITPQTRMLVIAHLFGGRANLEKVFPITKQYNILVVEDIAQGFQRMGDHGHADSDVAMFSFGPIKTATSLGGAVIQVKSRGLHQTMSKILESDPIQSSVGFARRILRFAVLKLLSSQSAAGLFRWWVERWGGSFDTFANSVSRGFSPSNLLAQLRQQPATSLLRLLDRRWHRYEFSRIERRVGMGQRMDARIGQVHGASHAYWVYPVIVRDPLTLRDRLRDAGFDATCLARLTVVPAIDDLRVPRHAEYCWNHMVFIPWYPELPDHAVDQIATVIEKSEPIALGQRSVHDGATNDERFKAFGVNEQISVKR